jgi:hypothetical protein
MSDPLSNPYAPPAGPSADVTGFAAKTDEASDYQSERRSVLLVLVLCVVSLGLYAPFWYLGRKPFLDSLNASKKVGQLPLISAFLYGATVVVAVLNLDPSERAIQAVGGLVALFLSFRVAAILRSDFRRTGRVIGVSSVGVFFFGCVYLQQVINEAAAVPARLARRAD